MFKTFVTLALTLFLCLSSTEINAATKKEKRKMTKGKIQSRYSQSGKKNKSKKSKRYSKYIRNKNGSVVDLRALTTESPYTDNPENGVNPLELKPGIQ